MKCHDLILDFLLFSHVFTHLMCNKKNPAYGRHRISRPMRIIGPIQFFFPKIFFPKFFFPKFFFQQTGEVYRWRVCYQRGLPRLVLDSVDNVLMTLHIMSD